MTGAHCRCRQWTTLHALLVAADEEPANGGIRREPALPEHEAITPEPASAAREFAIFDDEPDDEVPKARALSGRTPAIARQAAMDPNDGIEL